ncbi:MAG TPA: phage holin family protein [Longimicrobiales bacterium]
MKFLVRLIVTAIALWVAVQVIPGLEYHGGPFGLVGVALVFGIINALVRPILLLLTCPLVVLTLGLFLFVLNGILLWIAAACSSFLGISFQVHGIVPAILGGLVIGLVSMVLNVFVREKN